MPILIKNFKSPEMQEKFGRIDVPADKIAYYIKMRNYQLVDGVDKRIEIPSGDTNTTAENNADLDFDVTPNNLPKKRGPKPKAK